MENGMLNILFVEIFLIIGFKMSQTYTIYCKNCKKKYWAGQGNYLYDYAKLTKFLFLHEGHSLLFKNDTFLECETPESYELSSYQDQENQLNQDEYDYDGERGELPDEIEIAALTAKDITPKFKNIAQ